MKSRQWFVAVIAICLTAGTAHAQWAWEPVRDADRQMPAGTVDPNAGAEALFLKIRLEDVFDGQDLKSVLDQYIRIKVFSEADAQRLTAVRIPHGTRGVRVTDVAARTILADGTVLDVAARDMKDIRIARREGREWKAMSFAMPRVGPGTIVEYRWRETRFDVLADGITIDVQRDVPIRKAEIDIKPLQLSDWRLQIMPFSLSANVPAESVLGWYRCTAENVRALPDEPYAPPGRRQRGFVFAYYLRTDVTDQDSYWGAFSGRLAREVDENVGARDEVAALTKSIVAGATADSVKLQRLVRWCRREVRDLSFDEFMARRRRNREPKISDLLEARAATDLEAAVVLVAMAKAAGLRASLVLLESRSGLPYRKSVLNGAALSMPAVMVECEARGHLCTARARGIPWDGLPWEAEGMRGISCAKDSFTYMTSQVAGASSLDRVTDATLLANGDVEGTLRVRLSGHWVEEWFDRVHEPSEGEAAMRAINRWGQDGPRLSELAATVAGVDSDTVVVSMRFRWPSFATATEKRILVQPALWSARSPAMFAAETRQSSVMFPFCWSESDSIVFRLPAGARVEAGDSPPVFEAKPLLVHALGVSSTDKPGEFTFMRRMYCASAEHTTYPRSAYADVRQAFQTLAERDQYTLTLAKSAP